MMHLLSKWFNYLLFIFLVKTRQFRPLKEENDSVLLVQFAHIGDFIVWLDSARAFRKLYPNKKIIFLCRKFKSVRQLAQATGLFDEVIEVDDDWRHRICSMVSMMRRRYDTVINTRSTRDVQSDLYVLAPRSRQRIAPSSDLTCINKYWLRRSDAAYTMIVPCDGIETMELVRNAQFIRGLGLSEFRASIPVLPKFPPPKGLPQRYFAVCPGANNSANRWPVERFVEVIHAMEAKYRLPCVLLGTEDEQPIGRQIRDLVEYPDMLISLMGNTTLTEYIEAIRGAEFLISNDTSAGHIAPAVHTPAVVVQPGWNYGRFFPYRTEMENSSVPVSITAAMTCIGCGRDPTVENQRECLCNGVMKCVCNISSVAVLEKCAFELEPIGEQNEL